MPTMTPARSTAAPAPGPACADDPDLMFPLVESERPWRPTPGEAAAQAVCARCPVLAQCRRDVLTGEPAPYGVAGGLTVADRRAIRASQARPRPQPRPRSRRGSGGRGAGSCSRTCSPTRPCGDLETAIAQAMAVHARREHGADPVKVRELALEHRPATASRWEVALAAMALLACGMKVSPVARMLGENYTQLVRWRDRHAAGQALVRGGAGAGTAQLTRPAAVVAGTRPATGRRAAERGVSAPDRASEGTAADAVFSPCGRYRYLLTRNWDPGAPRGRVRDAQPFDRRPPQSTTPRSAAAWGSPERWGFGELRVANLFAARASNPTALLDTVAAGGDPVGPENPAHLASLAAAHSVVLAWGANADAVHGAAYPAQVAAELVASGASVFHLGRCADGSPRHPLYLPGDTRLTPWTAAT